MRKQNCLHSFSANFSTDLYDILYAAVTCWFVEARATFFMYIQYSREKCLLSWFYKVHR